LGDQTGSPIILDNPPFTAIHDAIRNFCQDGVHEQGQALLEGFNFFKVQNAWMMPDRVPLFGLQLASKEQFVSSLKERGLEID
jgi:hypothetical protein